MQLDVNPAIINAVLPTIKKANVGQDIAYFLESPNQIDSEAQKTHVEAAARLAHLLQSSSRNQAAYDEAYSQYVAAVRTRWSRHIDKGDRYFTDLADDFVEKVQSALSQDKGRQIAQ